MSRPPPVENYHQFMGGVDRNNQLRAKTPVGRPAKKWWKYILFYLINLCITNAYLVMKETPAVVRKRRYSLLDFRIELAKELINGFSFRERNVVVPNLNNTHRCARLNRPKRRCRNCVKFRNTRKETVYGCMSCDVNLCKDGCFEQYHRHFNLPFEYNQ